MATSKKNTPKVSQTDTPKEGNTNEKLTKELEVAIAQLLGFPQQHLVVTHNEKTGQIFLGGKELSPSEILNLKSEAEFISRSEFWKMCEETIKHQCEQVMFVKSTTFDDMKSGKQWLYHLSFMKKLMSIFRNYHAPQKR